MLLLFDEFPSTGNTGVSALGIVPAACPGALVVTAVSDMDGVGGASDYPPAWSNFLPLPDTGNLTSRLLAAPGGPFRHSICYMQ
jgi:hypothetical protein